MNEEKIITVFGSSRARPGGDVYKTAYELGRLLAQSGFTICNGGYMGIMEASSKGAKEVGGKTIGVVTHEFSNRTPNQWNDLVITTDTYLERLEKLIKMGNAYVVLKGGIGTLSELFLVWTLMAIGNLSKPVLLIGDKWKKAFNQLRKYLVIDEMELMLLYMVKDPVDAVKFLNKWFTV